MKLIFTRALQLTSFLSFLFANSLQAEGFFYNPSGLSAVEIAGLKIQEQTVKDNLKEYESAQEKLAKANPKDQTAVTQAEKEKEEAKNRLKASMEQLNANRLANKSNNGVVDRLNTATDAVDAKVRQEIAANRARTNGNEGVATGIDNTVKGLDELATQTATGGKLSQSMRDSEGIFQAQGNAEKPQYYEAPMEFHERGILRENGLTKEATPKNEISALSESQIADLKTGPPPSEQSTKEVAGGNPPLAPEPFNDTPISPKEGQSASADAPANATSPDAAKPKEAQSSLTDLWNDMFKPSEEGAAQNSSNSGNSLLDKVANISDQLESKQRLERTLGTQVAGKQFEKALETNISPAEVKEASAQLTRRDADTVAKMNDITEGFIRDNEIPNRDLNRAGRALERLEDITPEEALSIKGVVPKNSDVYNEVANNTKQELQANAALNYGTELIRDQQAVFHRYQETGTKAQAAAATVAEANLKNYYGNQWSYLQGLQAGQAPATPPPAAAPAQVPYSQAPRLPSQYGSGTYEAKSVSIPRPLSERPATPPGAPAGSYYLTDTYEISGQWSPSKSVEASNKAGYQVNIYYTSQGYFRRFDDGSYARWTQ